MASAKHDVLQLLLPMFSGTKNDFGKDVVPPLPLSYDRVKENRLPLASSAASILFRLPIELLSFIMQLLPPGSIASLALVSRDCRQFARSRQFASVHLDYGDSSFELLKVLLEEGKERARNNGSTISLSLGACIRRLTVATNPGWVTHRHGIALDEAFINLEDSVRKEREADASNVFFDWYIPTIQEVIVSALPHLELIDWEDKINLPRSFFTSLTQSPVQHLKLFRVRVDEEFDLEVTDSLLNHGWPLRTLHLELFWNIFNHSEGSTSRLCEDIFRVCAPTLESLEWIGPISHKESQKTDSQSAVAGDLGHLHFPRLSTLKLDRQPYSDSRTLNALLGTESECRLRVLQADTEIDKTTSLCFENRGTIPSLETFVWLSPRLPPDHSLGFLRSNTQLSKLDVYFATPPILLEEQLLPLLSRSFSSLKSLRLAWDDTSIPDSALELISSLGSLEQICLSAGEQFTWRHNWLIDHDAMRRNLAKLTRLRKIAFPRDSYNNKTGFVETERYYEMRVPVLGRNEALWADTRRGANLEQIWERQHQHMILVEANKYIRVLPKLEWLYFGQLPMRVTERRDESDEDSEGFDEENGGSDENYGVSDEENDVIDEESDVVDEENDVVEEIDGFDEENDESDGPSDRSDGGKRKAVILSEERDDCYTLLSRIFGAEGYLFEA